MKKITATILLMLSICVMLTGCKKPANPPTPDPDPKPPVTEPNDKDNDNGGEDGDKDGGEIKIPVDEDFNDMASRQVSRYYDTLDEFLEFINKADFKKKYMNYFEETLKEMRSEGKVLMVSYKGKVDSFKGIELICNFDSNLRPNYNSSFDKEDITFGYQIDYVKKDRRELLNKGYEKYIKKYDPENHPLPDNWKEVAPKDYKGVYNDEVNMGGVKTKCVVSVASSCCVFDFVKDEKIVSIVILTGNIEAAKEILKDLKLEYVKLK